MSDAAALSGECVAKMNPHARRAWRGRVEGRRKWHSPESPLPAMRKSGAVRAW